jgi:hypothetical protein
VCGTVAGLADGAAGVEVGDEVYRGLPRSIIEPPSWWFRHANWVMLACGDVISRAHGEQLRAVDIAVSCADLPEVL